jgi:predicted acylesterase/phospholipase RssA
MTTESNFTPTPKLVTLNCSGGISLGAYMAGVFYELTKEAVKPEPKIIIDIITGASAGAMTGVIATYCLMGNDKKQLLSNDTTQNVFYKAWVEKVDIKAIDSFSVTLNSFTDGFLATIDSFKDSFWATIDNYANSKNGFKKNIGNKFKKTKINYKEERDRKKLSILSGEAIAQVAKLVGWQQNSENLSNTKDYSLNIPRITEDAKPVALLMTVTNLQGLLETVELSSLQNTLNPSISRQDIKTITYAETRQFLFSSRLKDDPKKLHDMWQKAVQGGLASGAFPAAFPPKWDESNINSVNLKGLSEDYFITKEKSKLNKEELEAIYIQDERLAFLYTDGGILNGLPILQGIDLVRELRYPQDEDDAFTRDFKKQFFENKPQDDSERLHVYIRPIPVEDLKSNKRLTRGHFSMLEVALSGLALPKEEHDSIRLQEIEKRNQIVEAKQELLKNLNSDRLLEIQPLLDKAIPYQHVELRPITPAILSNITDHQNHPKLSQLQPIYDALLEQIRKGNKEAQLQEGGAAQLLASDFLGAFGGFFDKRYREHDFLIGRLCGIAWLQENCHEVKLTEQEINDLIVEIKGNRKSAGKILTEDPTPSNLKLSQKIRIGRIILRTLRILIIESKVVGFVWILVLGSINLTLILVLAILEIIATLALVIVDGFEIIWAKLLG